MSAESTKSPTRKSAKKTSTVRRKSTKASSTSRKKGTNFAQLKKLGKSVEKDFGDLLRHHDLKKFTNGMTKNIQGIKKEVNSLTQSEVKDLKKEMNSLKGKFLKEKKRIETELEKKVKKEIQDAKNLLQSQKKVLSTWQSKVDSLFKK